MLTVDAEEFNKAVEQMMICATKMKDGDGLCVPTGMPRILITTGELKGMMMFDKNRINAIVLGALSALAGEPVVGPDDDVNIWGRNSGDPRA